MGADKLHTLRVRARELVDEGRFGEAMCRYVEAAEYADHIGVRVEGEQLRARARQVIVFVWARARGLDIGFDAVRPVYVPAGGLLIGPTRRFTIRTSEGELTALVDSSDRVRLAPRRKT